MAHDLKYALVDAAAEPELLNLLEELDPPVACLYAEPLPDELLALAPYLIQLTPEVEQWLQERSSHWGIFLTSDADLRRLTQHLRKYLQVLIPGQEKPVFLRFYDPRNIWLFLSALSDWELHTFLGPVQLIATGGNDSYREDDFRVRREVFPRGSRSRKKKCCL